jgi:hypothetical protein
VSRHLYKEEIVTTIEQKLVTCIGAYRVTPPNDEEGCRLWIGDDLRALFRRCVEGGCAGFPVVYGVSAQLIAPYDLSYTRRLLSREPRQLL